MARKADRDRIRSKVAALVALMGLDETEWDVDFGEEGLRIETIGGKTYNADRLPMKAFEDAVDFATSCFRFTTARREGLIAAMSTPQRPADFALASEDADKDYEVVDEAKS